MQLTDAVAAQVMGEINTLTKRIDRLNGEIQQKIEAFPGAADKEMNRAGGEYLASMSSELIRVVKQNSGDSNAVERQKTLVWAIGSLTVLSMFMFGTGMALGSQVGLGVGLLAAFALGIGLVGGMVLCQTLIAGEQVNVKAKTIGNKAGFKAESENKWTEAGLMKAALNTMETKDPHVLAACRDVLVNGTDMFPAAQKAKIGYQDLKSAIENLQKKDAEFIVKI